MNQLVLRKYLLQQALAAKLDRQPSVLLDILRSREQILASAYINRTVAEKTITQVDIDTYIANNPLKFANRQLLSVEEIMFPIGPTAQAVVDASKDLQTLDAIDQMLTSMSVPHNRSMGGLNTADIPQTLFNTIKAKKADDVFFVRSGQNGVFFKVTGEESRPLEGEAAFNVARQFIRAEKINAELGFSSVAANREAKYQGEYATIMANEANGKK